MSDQKPQLTGNPRGPFNDTVATMAVMIMSGAKTSGNPPAHIAAMLDVVRDVHADTPAFVTAVCSAVMYYSEERGLLGA